MEARGGIEPPIKVLQTFALPLGDRAGLLVAQGNHSIGNASGYIEDSYGVDLPASGCPQTRSSKGETHEGD